MYKIKYHKYKEKYLNIKNNNLIGGAGDIFVIGIAGCSGCGKSTLAIKIKESLIASNPIFNTDNVLLLPYDNYFNDMPEFIDENHNGDAPDVYNTPLLIDNLKKLIKKEPVNLARFNFETNKIADPDPTTYTNPDLKVIIVEGLYCLYHKELRDIFNLKLFTLLDPDISLLRRMNRDIFRKTTGPITEEIYNNFTKQYVEEVKYSYKTFIEPTLIHADIIISTNTKTDLSNTYDMINTFVLKKITE